MTADDRQTYWVIPRDILDQTKSDAERHRALLTYVVLFGGPALISDSATVRNSFLRRAIRSDVGASGDGFIRELIDRRFLRFAIRTVDDVDVSLAATAVKLNSRFGTARVGYEPLDETAEFDYIEKNAHLVRYDSGDAEDWYQRQTLRIFRDMPFDPVQLPETYRRAVVAVLGDHIEQKKPYFGLSDFRADSALWQDIVRRTGKPHLWDRCGAFIHDVARGPYVTFLPQKLGVSPTYSPYDRLGLNYLRGVRDEDEQVLDVHELRRRLLRLADFVAGLRVLTVDDIDALRNSDERRAYDGAMLLYAMSLSDSRDVATALTTYRMRIDDRIRRRLSGVDPEEEIVEAKVGIIRSLGTDTVRFIFVELFAALLPPESGELGKAGIRYMWDRFFELDRREIEEAQRVEGREAVRKQMEAAEIENESILDDFVRAGSPVVESSITVDKNGGHASIINVSS
jgi:hypothetical protein